MVLAGVEALSLAVTIFQVIDFSSKIVSKGKELYSSSNGVLRENQATETVASHLHAMSRRLVYTLRTESNAPSEQDAMLKKICENCIALSQELLEHLGKLQVPKTGDRKWKSFRQALKSIWSKQGVDELARRLEDARHDLDTFVLLQVREGLTETTLQREKQYLTLDKGIQTIIQLLLENKISPKKDLSAQMQEMVFSPMRRWDGAQGHLDERRAAWIARDTETRKQLVEISFLESLRFPMMPSRKERIAKAHEETFRWIFKDPKAIHKPWNSFVRWLRNEGGIYWINGKAASGKSTLMKYISYSRVAMESLRNWSTHSGDTRIDLLTGSFFFWNSGIPEQRSQIGLLRSLLYEILNARKYLIPEVFPNEWEDKCSLVSHGLRISFEAWSLPRLECAFQTLTSLASNRKFCFFIDGLDEFEGDHRRMSTLFKDLSSNPNVKFCVSSRPWPIFQTMFKEAPQLRLQDLTLDDIKTYVEKELLETEDMQQLISEDPKDTGARILVEDIVTKAAGVFLWVVLVVRSLLAGLENGDGVIHLRKRLDLLPADLEDLYESMLDSIEDVYLEQSSQIFQIFRAADYNLTIPVLFGTLKATFPEAMKVQWRGNMEEAHLKHKQLSLYRSLYAQYNRVQSQLNSRTKGLLEVEYFNRPAKSEEVIIDDDDEVKFPSITYLHRTTRDYIESPKIWNKLVRHTRKTNPEPRSALFMYHLIEIKSNWDIAKLSIKEKGAIILGVVQHLDESSSNVRICLMDELDRVFTRASTHEGSRAYQERHQHWSNCLMGDVGSNILSLCFSYGLVWYIASKLKAEPDMTTYAMRHLDSIIKINHTNEQSVLPLLGYALSLHRWAAPGGCVPDVEFTEVLLKHSADPNRRHMGHTLWQYVLEYLYLAHHHSNADSILGVVWPRIVRLLLQYGADPYAHCIGDYNIWTRAFESIEKTEWGVQAAAWIEYPHVQQQDATSVIKTVFQNLTSTEMKGLIDLLEEKRASQAGFLSEMSETSEVSIRNL